MSLVTFTKQVGLSLRLQMFWSVFAAIAYFFHQLRYTLNCHPGSSLYTWSSAHKAGDRIHKVREKSRETNYFLISLKGKVKEKSKETKINLSKIRKWIYSNKRFSLTSGFWLSSYDIYMFVYLYMCIYRCVYMYTYI